MATTVSARGQTADLSIAKVASPEAVSEGDVVVYTITVANGGPDAAGDVTITDPLPAELVSNSMEASQGACNGTSLITCDLGTLASGENGVVTIVATVLVEGASNTATVSGTASDPDTSNNTAAAALAITAGGCSLIL